MNILIVYYLFRATLEPVQDRYELLSVVGGRSAETRVYWSQ